MSGELHYGGPLGPLLSCLRAVLYGQPLSLAILEARDFYNLSARAPREKNGRR